MGPSSSSSMAPLGWQPSSTLGHTNPAAFQQLASSVSLARAQKRRFEADDDTAGGRDTSMDRSPTPERPKRAAPKRTRVLSPSDALTKDDNGLKENKDPSGTDDHDVDVGVLLASLPTQSLLPLLTSLLNAQPSLKTTILPLIPRPTIEIVTQALGQSAKKLRDAYPYSSSSTFSQPSFSTSFTFGRSSNGNSTAASFPAGQHNGMRDSYVISRLRPHISEFVAACFSYLPYFSSLSSPTSGHATTLQTLQKDKSHPSETFSFLCAVTNHIISQPPLAQAELVQQLIPRLSEEWKAWVNHVDDIVNRSGGMFGRETVEQWGRALDEMAEAKMVDGNEVMRRTKELWVLKVGWLIGRNAMDVVTDSSSAAASYFDTDSISDLDFLYPVSDHHHLSHFHIDPSVVGTPVSTAVPGDPLFAVSSRFPLARTRSDLYNNLLRLLHQERPPYIPVLLDYHDLHPHLRSARSYNLLISLAIRTGSYGTVRWLFESMHADRVHRNLETWKLRVRWLVRSGMWDQAWSETTKIWPRSNTRLEKDGKVVFRSTVTLPLPLWMEFWRSPKIGTMRIQQSHLRQTVDPQSPIPNDKPSPGSKVFNSPDSDLDAKRYHTLMNNRPTFIPHDLCKTPPKLVYNVVWIMLHTGKADRALSFAKDYLGSLPPFIPAPRYHSCLQIFHLLIAKWSSQTGLRRLYETRRMMVSLLATYPTLKPTPATLFLLLAPLHRVKRCGTVADNIVQAFKSEYGPRTEDRRVRRRVAMLALKEGRRDIVSRMLRVERRARRAHAIWRLEKEVVGTLVKPLPSRFSRPPIRRIFRRKGQEERKWCRLFNRVSRIRRHKRNRTI
ncbi:hypothetical protein H0H93_015210 [Arthromyces matolae]|nr:hypothetical protein H0H93_015210 [Arthromyces matolae]